MTGLALVLSELPAEIVRRHPERVYDGGGHAEWQFHWWQTPALLPVQWQGTFRILPWGCKDRRSRLPQGGWISLAQVEAGALAAARPDEVVIPANLGYHRGVWFLVEQGFRGVVLQTGPHGPVVYMLTEPSTNYFRDMTEQSEMMPILVNQVS